MIPAVPDIPGIGHVLEQPPREEGGTVFERAVFHSSDYKNREQLAGRKVMILGTGETGMDLAYESAKAGAKEVVLCSRAGYVQMCCFHLAMPVKCAFLAASSPSQRR